MRRRDRQVEEKLGPALTASGQNTATAFQQVANTNRGELLWIAEVMTGSRLAGEQCLAEAIELAHAAQYVAPEWMLSWIKRTLAHVALRRMSSEIRERLSSGRPRISTTTAKPGIDMGERRRLLCTHPQSMIGSLDALERACFILHVYLEYPVLDCGLLLGCPRGWVESICAHNFTRIEPIDQGNQHGCRDLNLFLSPGVTPCAN